MVGLEDVAEALPSTLSGPLALHSFVALGSSSQPSQVCVGAGQFACLSVGHQVTSLQSATFTSMLYCRYS